MVEIKASISPIWKDRILDLIRIVNILLSFYSIWLVNSGNEAKYNIPLIITIFMIVNIFLTILLGEHMRSLDPKLVELEKEYQQIKARDKQWEEEKIMQVLKRLF